MRLVIISNKIKEFVHKQKLGYVATVSPTGMPNLSPKGTIIVWDSKTLAFANIRSPNTMNNLKHNPNAEINVIDPILRKGYRFSGKGTIIKNEPLFSEILEYYKKNGVQSIIDAIVLIDVNVIQEVSSPLYDLGYTEEEMKTKWKKYLLDS